MTARLLRVTSPTSSGQVTLSSRIGGSGPTSTLVAHLSRGQVALWVRSVVVSSCVPGEGALPVPPPLQVELVAPLGNRKLVNGATGQPVPQFMPGCCCSRGCSRPGTAVAGLLAADRDQDRPLQRPSPGAKMGSSTRSAWIRR
jgi:hypothetical protein